MPQLVPSLQSPWDESSVPGLAKALAAEKEQQGQTDTRTEGHLPLSPSCHLDCPFPKPLPASVSLSPLLSAGPALQHDGTPDHPGGAQPSLVTPAAPRRGRCPLGRERSGSRSAWRLSGSALAGTSLQCQCGPWQGEGGCSRDPQLEPGTAHLGLAQPQPQRAVEGLFSAWTGRRMNSIMGSRFYSTCQGA